MSTPIVYYWPPDDHPRPYWVFQALLFGRSVLIVLLVFLFEFGFRRNPHSLAVVFRSVKVDEKSMKVFGIVTSGGDPSETPPGSSRRIFSSYSWILRIALVLTVCYFWESLCVVNDQFDAEKWWHRNEIVSHCATGWNCYSLRDYSEKRNTTQVRTLRDFLRISFVWDLASICDHFMQSGAVEWTRGGDGWFKAWTVSRRNAVTCFKPAQIGFSSILAVLAISFATFELVVITFEIVIALAMKHRRTRLNAKTIVNVLIVASGILWVVIIVYESFTSISTWVSRVSFLAIPLILFQSRRVANTLSEVQYYRNQVRTKRLRETELGSELDKMLKEGQHSDDVSNWSLYTANSEQPAPRLRRRGRLSKMSHLLARFEKRHE